MKKCLTSLIIKKLQNKKDTTYTHIQSAKIKTDNA